MRNKTTYLASVAIVLGLLLAGYDLLTHKPQIQFFDKQGNAQGTNGKNLPSIIINGDPISAEIVALWTKGLTDDENAEVLRARVAQLVRQEVLVRDSIQRGKVLSDSTLREQLLYKDYDELKEKWSLLQPEMSELEAIYEQQKSKYSKKNLDIIMYSIASDTALAQFGSAQALKDSIQLNASLENRSVIVTILSKQNLNRPSVLNDIAGLNVQAFFDRAESDTIYGPVTDENQNWIVLKVVEVHFVPVPFAQVQEQVLQSWQNQRVIDEISQKADFLVEQADIEFIFPSVPSENK